MTELTIRKARPDERAMLEDLQWRASLTHPAYRDALSRDRNIVHLPVEHITGGGTLVAETAGTVAGFAVVLPLEAGEAELDGLFVEPDHFGRGTGRLLVAEAKALAVELGASALRVVAALEAERFYRNCGFEPAGETDTLLGKALVMTAPLRSV